MKSHTPASVAANNGRLLIVPAFRNAPVPECAPPRNSRGTLACKCLIYRPVFLAHPNCVSRRRFGSNPLSFTLVPSFSASSHTPCRSEAGPG